MKKFGALFLLLGLVALGIGIFGFVKVGNSGNAYDVAQSVANVVSELSETKVTVNGGFEGFAMSNRVWLTIAGGVATLAGCAMSFKKNS